MFTKMMVPVDLGHLPAQQKALAAAAATARAFDLPVCYVGVTAATPGKLGHNPKEFASALARFGEEQAKLHGLVTSTHTAVAHDPTTDLDDTLLRAVDETGADIVVMASHIPTLTDHLWPSNGGRIAAHARASVFVVRGD